MNKACLALIAAALFGLAALPHAAHADLITNGNFENTTPAAGAPANTTTGWISPYVDVQVTGWTANNAAFLFSAGSGDTTGVTTRWDGSTIKFWGPNNNVNNGFTAASPAGGNFVALDADAGSQSSISQTITGLTVGSTYQVGFYYAFAQEMGYTNTSIPTLTVSLGNESDLLGGNILPSEGFSGWMYVTETFTATATSEVLTFLADGNDAAPPFALLDGVTMNEVPEPATFTVLGTGLLAIGYVTRRRIRQQTNTNNA